MFRDLIGEICRHFLPRSPSSLLLHFSVMSKREKKKKKEKKEWIPSESAEDDEKPGEVLYSGYVERKVSSWKAVYCVIVGGSFYWFKSPSVRASEILSMH